MQCQSGTGASLPGTWETMGQPIIRKPAVVRDACIEPTMDSKEEALDDLEDNEDVYNRLDEMEDLAREKKFSLNSYDDEWDDYDSWGVDKRANMEHSGSDKILGWDRNMDHSHTNHMGKRGGGIMNNRYQDVQPYLRLSRKLGSM